MELQAMAGFQQGGHPSRKFWSTHNSKELLSSSIPPVTVKMRSVGLWGRSLGVGRERRGVEGGVVGISCSSEAGTGGKGVKKEVLKAGSPVVVKEAPPLLKTAEPMPMMRPNNGLINAGDAGRVIDRRPKNVWAVRFAVGAFLIDRKYFEPLEL